MSKIKKSLAENFNDEMIMSFISTEMIEYWKVMKLDELELINCGKHLLNAMHNIWKERYKRNEVRYEKCERTPIQGPINYNFESKTKVDKILQISSIEMLPVNKRSVHIFC